MTSTPTTRTSRPQGLAVKLAGGFLLLTAVTAAVGLYGLSRLGAIHGRAAELVGRDLPRVERAGEARTHVLEARTALRNLLDASVDSRAQAVEEQTVTTNEIGRSVNEAATGSSEIARNVSGVADAAKDTTRCAVDTQQAAQELTRISSELTELVGHFRI